MTRYDTMHDQSPKRKRGPRFVRSCAALACASGSVHRSLALAARNAFTLLEVLVVVAVIALLAAVLLPSLHQAREQTKRATCLSNIRQIAAGWHQYLQDSQGRFFQYQLYDASGNPIASVNTQFVYGGRQTSFSPIPSRPLNKYVLNLNPKNIKISGTQVFLCPSDRAEVFGLTTSTTYEYYGNSYEANEFLVNQPPQWTNRPFTPKKLRILPTLSAANPNVSLWNDLDRRMHSMTRSSIQNESKLILLGDLTWNDSWDAGRSFNNCNSPIWHERPCSHNIAYMDGHAEFVRIRKGYHHTSRYTVIPFRALYEEAVSVQRSPDCPDPVASCCQ